MNNIKLAFYLITGMLLITALLIAIKNSNEIDIKNCSFEHERQKLSKKYSLDRALSIEELNKMNDEMNDFDKRMTEAFKNGDCLKK